MKHEKQNTKGIIRFAMPTILRRTQIVDYLFAFLHNYSDVELKIINANAVTSILEDSADLGLSTQMINDKKRIHNNIIMYILFTLIKISNYQKINSALIPHKGKLSGK